MVLQLLLLAAVAASIVLGQALADNIWGLPHFTHIRGLSSVVHNNILYLEGGRIYNGTNLDHLSYWTMGSTLMISLDEPWSAANVTVTAIDKQRSFPNAEKPYVWYNTVDDKIQLIGGIIYFYGQQIWRVSSQRVINAESYIPGQALWELSPTANGWTDKTIPPPPYIYRMQCGSVVATDAALYSMGGNIYVDPNYTLYVQPGLVEFDFETRYWFNYTTQGNNTTQGYGPKGSSMYAESVYTSLFGEQGVIIYIGGYTVEDTKRLQQGSPQYLQDMSEIWMWDIGGQRVLSQRTTGNKPPSRWGSMVVGVSETGSGTFDIFVHGGFTALGVNEVFDPDIANVFVLSIPSFVWTKIPDSTATMRGYGTADIIGQSQMVIVGGSDATQPDPGFPSDVWQNAIGLFDLNLWRWTAGHRPDAGPYKRASALVEVSTKTPFAKFDSPEVAMVFNPQGSKSTSPEGSSRNNTFSPGAIAGIVVGGVLGLVVIAGIVWFIVTRKKKKINAKPTISPPYEELKKDMSKQDMTAPRQIVELELDGAGRRYELEEGRQWELESSVVSVRHEMEALPYPSVKAFDTRRDSDTLVSGG